MEDGRELDKEKTTKALVAQGLGLASFEKQESAVPEAAYLLTVTGTG